MTKLGSFLGTGAFILGNMVIIEVLTKMIDPQDMGISHSGFVLICDKNFTQSITACTTLLMMTKLGSFLGTGALISGKTAIIKVPARMMILRTWVSHIADSVLMYETKNFTQSIKGHISLLQMAKLG